MGLNEQIGVTNASPQTGTHSYAGDSLIQKDVLYKALIKSTQESSKEVFTGRSYYSDKFQNG